ncbi:MAG: hypothetical protein QOJ64_3117 [Acidobacteriota bacterium]|jgi:hypothetical protein|nr:hypothetical protein [Acidobacteriota bacterium]
MSRMKLTLTAVVAFKLVLLLSIPVLAQSNDPTKQSAESSPIDKIISAATKSILDDDWSSAESGFRQAVKLEPQQGLWRIQLTIALGQQKKWKEAFKEFDKVMELGMVGWVLTINKKLPNGKLAFVNTETFSGDKSGIERYVIAVREKKKIDSISKDIGAKLDEFANKNGFALIYDISSFRGTRFESGNTLDVTKEFIDYYNERAKK